MAQRQRVGERSSGMTAVTVRLDSGMKSQFDELCSQFGMSVNTAFNIFVNAVVTSRKIPFEIKGRQREKSMDGLQAWKEIRAMAEAGKFPELTLDEINEEIRLAREERKAREMASL